MPDFTLIRKLREICETSSTLLWLEGSRYERVTNVKLNNGKLILNLSDETCRVVAFDRYAITKVGLQFWSQGRPGVLYRWDQVSTQTAAANESDHPGDEPPPPNMAA